MKKIPLFFILFVLLVSLGLSACSLSLAQDVTPPPGYQSPVIEEPQLLTGAFPQQAPDLENGAAIYQEKCVDCHGSTGLGDGSLAAQLNGEVAKIGTEEVADFASPLEWFSIVLLGNIEKLMPPFSNSLTEQDAWDVVSYAYTFTSSEEVISEGAALFEETCAACHGSEGQAPLAPGAFDFRDSKQLVTLPLETIIQKIATGNGNQEHVFGTGLDTDQQKAVAMYVRSLALPVSGVPVEVADTEPTAAPTEEPVAEEPADEEAVPTEESEPKPDNLGQVTGEILNGSGGDVPDGLEVLLEVYEPNASQSFELVYTATVPAQEDGTFVFEDVVFDTSRIYFTSVEMNEMFFPSDFMMGEEIIGDNIDLPVTIYEMTSDTSQLSISRVHIFIQLTEQGTALVHNQLTFSNFGSEMVAPEVDADPVLNFSLPAGATNLNFPNSTGNPFVRTASGFGDSTPVLPGSNTYDLVYNYELPFDGKLDLVLPVDYPTDVSAFLIQGEDTKVESEILIPSGMETLGEELYQVFITNALSAGQEIDLSISTSGGLTLEIILLVVAGLGVVGFGAWRLFKTSSEMEEFEGEADDPADDLIDEIADLDEAFIAGEIDEALYRSKRNALKSKLQKLLDQEEAK